LSRPGARQFFHTYNPTQEIREDDDSKLQNLLSHHTKKTKNNTKSPQEQATMKTGKKMTMSLVNFQRNHGKKQQPGRNEDTSASSRVASLPPPVVETVVTSSQSLTSSIGIGEFGMNQSRRGSAAAFSMAVKDNLFPKIKFLKGTNASLDFSLDTTSICGYLRICCGVSENDAYQWWDDHRGMLKTVHTDFRNNKIKMIKQQFNGKFTCSGRTICGT
jgi:hypothetical protein